MGTLRKIEGLGTPSGKTKTKVTITASEVTGMDDLEIQCTDMEIQIYILLHTKGQIKPKADWHAVDSPKK